MNVLDVFTGGPSSFVTGIERLADGALKVYVGARYKGIYIVITDERDADAVERAWAGQVHVLIPVPPPEALYREEPARVPTPPEAQKSNDDRLYRSLHSAREKLCVAQTDLPAAHKQHRFELQVAIDTIDRLGVFYAPAQWSKFDEPPTPPAEAT